jgi:cell division cycle 2-like protein
MADTSAKRSRWASDEEDESPKEKKKLEKKKNTPKPTTVAPTEQPTPAPAPRVIKANPPPKQLNYLAQCRHVNCYERLNHIEEGSYGIVFRARDKETGEIVALKKLKLEPEQGGFPVTSLREIHALMIIKHPNIVNVREIVMGNQMDQ